MKRLLSEEILLSGAVLLSMGIAPNLFPADLAGLAKLSATGPTVLLPSIVVVCIVTAVARARGHGRLVNRVLVGALAGLLGTLGLEVVRATSFRLGGMPGDMPRLLGVLLTDRFMLGPDLGSDLLGWAYHFWNGIAFGVIFTVLLGRRGRIWTIVYAQLIGFGLLLGPVVKSFGIGFMGRDMPAMPLTVVLAHLVFGWILGSVIKSRVRDEGWLLAAPDRTPQGVIGTVEASPGKA